MEQITFNQLHLAAIDFVNTENENYHKQLKVIGKWYHLYLNNNDVDKIYLNAPCFSDDFKVIAFNYLRAFTFLHHFINNVVLCSEYSEKCLFNIFDFKAKKREQTIKDLVFSFKKQKGNILIWGNNEEVITPTDSFLPLFNEQELVDFGDKVTTANTFKLFQIIKNHNLVQKPVIVNVKNLFIAFNNLKEDNFKNFISECFFHINNRITDDDAENIEEELESLNLKQSIKIKYPNSNKIHPWITNIASKNFNLILKERLAYKEIDDDDIYLTPQEIQNEPIDFNIPEIEIIETNHSKDLYEHLRLFREDWANLELNKFVYPFPKYWFLLINNQLTPEEWLTLFSEHYPFINNNPIVHKLKKIISELLAINWTTKLSTRLINFYFPEIKHHTRERNCGNLFRLFKNCLPKNISITNDYQLDNKESQFFLDVFNTIDIVNKMHTESFASCKLIIPDFLFYSYNPYLRYSVFKYAYTPITSQARLTLDVENELKTKELIEKYNTKKTDLLKEARVGIKKYDSKFITETKEEETDDIIDKEETELVDLDFTNEEESEIEEKKYTKPIDLNNNYHIKTDDFEINLKENEGVLVKKNSIVETVVSNLQVGDYFIIINSFKNIIANNDNRVIKFNRLTEELPNIVSGYKSRLNTEINIFNRLKENGLSFSENHFKNDYLNKKEFSLPRSLKDWGIICDLLNIDRVYRDLSFIIWKGKSGSNSPKKLYEGVLQFLIDENLIGLIDSEYCVNILAIEIQKKHFEYYKNLKNNIEVFSLNDFAKMILTNIKNQLVFNEVKSIIKY